MNLQIKILLMIVLIIVFIINLIIIYSLCLISSKRFRIEERDMQIKHLKN